MYREALRRSLKEVRPGATLWLSPTNRASQEIRKNLLDSSLTAVFNPNIFTFDEFARRILDADPQRVAALPGAVQRVLLRGIVKDLLGRGKLKYFAGIARTSGFLDTLLAFISELKQGDAWPEDFQRICGELGGHARDRELALIYAAYQSLLVDRNLYDKEGLFWSAREALKQGHWGPFAGLSLVVADGFTDFTLAQYEILFQLARTAEKTCVSLILDPSGSASPLIRADLFAKTQGVLDRLQAKAAVEIEFHTTPVDSSATSASLSHLNQTLFANPREIRPSSQAEGIEILAVAGQLGEVQALAARVKQLLISGVKPDEVVVAVRNIDQYASLIHEVFSAAGIPFACEAGEPLSRAPLLKALLALLQTEAEDWPFERLLTLLNSNYFRPDWEEFAHVDAARDTVAALRKWKLSQKRTFILAALEREASRGLGGLPADSEIVLKVQREIQTARTALALLARLSLATEPLRQAHDLQSWEKVISALAQELGMLRALTPAETAPDSTPDVDRPTWKLFRELLAAVAQAERLSVTGSESPAPRSLSDFLIELTDLLHTQMVFHSPPEEGRVRVLDAPQVRNLDIPYLFLAGLTETSFPQHRGDDCLYNQAERHQLNEMGLSLGHRTARNQEEMLMFYGIVTRARRKLVLSYPAVGGNGQPLSPSPYLTTLRALFDAQSLRFTLEEQLDPVPPADRILSAADVRVYSMQQALDNRPGLFRALCEQPDFAPATGNVLSAVDMAVRRFHTPGFSNYEGRLENPRTIETLSKRFSREYEFSATQLEGYAECPFRFFMSDVLFVKPLESPELETDFAQRGTLVHDVLAALHRQLSGDTDPAKIGEILPAGVELAQQFVALLEARLGETPELSELREALLRVEHRLLSEWAEAYGRQWDQYRTGWNQSFEVSPAPHQFERPFGTPLSKSEPGDGPATPCLTLGDGESEVRIRGRIDRIDVGRVEGETCFTVIDYKTGRRKQSNLEEIAAGRTLQLPLYMLAVERLNLVGDAARPGQMGYWFLKEQGFVPGLKPERGKASDESLSPLDAAVWESVLEILERVVPKLAGGIRTGDFPVFNNDPHCTGYCPFNTVCRVTQIRALPESLEKTLLLETE